MAKVAELNIQRKSLKDVKPNPKNPRLHSREQLQRLEKSLEDFGYAKGSMVVNKDGYLLAGHGVYESLRAKGYEEADFVIVDLEPGVAEAWMIADNRLGDLSYFDMPELEALTAEIIDMDVDLDMTGFGDLGEMEEMGIKRKTNAVQTKAKDGDELIVCPECGNEFVAQSGGSNPSQPLKIAGQKVHVC